MSFQLDHWAFPPFLELLSASLRLRRCFEPSSFPFFWTLPLCPCHPGCLSVGHGLVEEAAWLHARFRLVIQCHLSLKLYAPTQFHLRPCVRVQKYDSPTSLSYQGVRYVGREGEASRSRARSKGLHSLNFQSAGPGRGH